MHPLLLRIADSQPNHQLPIQAFCDFLGISRQALHKAKKKSKMEIEKWTLLPKLVRDYRFKKDRRAGSRSLYFNLDIMGKFGVGINSFEHKMADLGLTLKPLRTRVVTTKSSMQSWNYRNLINGITISGINKVVVGDLTYLNIKSRRYYLFCLTDIYSARVVGFGFGPSMATENALCALEMWKSLRGADNLKNCIHHTDGGGQYFSNLYLADLGRLNVQSSRAENCLQNGYAEQRNGLIKNHLLPITKGSTEQRIRIELSGLIENYNMHRKQEELGWLSPVEFENSLKNNHLCLNKVLHNFEPKRIQVLEGI